MIVLGLDMVKIYVLIDPRDGQIRYVGKTTTTLGKRRAHHVQEARNPRFTHRRAQWIRHLLSLGLKPEIELLCEVDQQHWAECERSWIAYFRAELGDRLINHGDGGEGNPGYRHSDASREAIKAGVRRAYAEGRTNSRKGAKFTPEQRARLSAAHVGLDNHQIGRRHTPETIAKIKAARAKQHAEGRSPSLKYYKDKV